MIEFRLPDVGEGLDEAEVVRWLVEPGERVARDQPIVEIQTDKALVEIPSPQAGTVSRLAAEAGAVVKVGDLLFVLDGAEAPAGPLSPDPAGAVPESPLAAAPAGDASAAEAAADEPAAGPRRLRPRAAPVVRKLAVELGVELGSIAGTGPGGRVLAEDVRQAAAAPGAGAPTDELAPRRAAAQAAAAAASRFGAATPAAPARPGPEPGERPSAPGAAAAAGEAARVEPAVPPGTLGQAAPGRLPIAGVRRVIAQTMTRAWTTIPHIHGHDELDARPLVDAVRGLRRRAAQRDPESAERLTLAVFFVLAAARALRRFPMVNASIDLDGREIVIHDRVNVGLAVATPVGLIVPVVRDADRLGLHALAQEIDRLARAARERRVTPEELRDGTFTVTNFGSLGGRFANPIIRPPEVGILGFGAVRERPWVVDGRLEPRPVLPISFGADHRLIDGDLSVAFQEHVRELLSDPVHLLLGE